MIGTRTRWFCAAVAIATLSGTAAVQAASCDRSCLKQITDQYFDAMAAHSTSGLPLAAKVKFTENGKQLNLGEGLWKTAGRATYRMDIFDPESGGAGVSAVVLENGQPAILMLRLKVADGKISEAETILCRKGDAGVLWAPDKLKQPSPNFSRTIRVAEQNSRFELMAAADAYFRAFETEGTPEYARIYDRRYPVVDVEQGVVLGIVRFGRKLNPDGTEIPLERPTQAQGSPLVAEFFSVTAGKIREIEAVLITAPLSSPTGW